MKTERIIERSWYLKNEPALTEAVFKGAPSDVGGKRFETGKAIYIEGENNELTVLVGIMSTYENAEIGCFDIFRRYLKHFDTTRYMEVLYAIDTYCMNLWRSAHWKRWDRPQLPEIKTDFKHNHIVDGLLNDSRGILLWHHQLENFYSFLNSDREAAIRFRKGILSKKPAFLETAAGIRIDATTTLKDIIKERMIFCGTSKGYFKEARDLYQYLNEDK